MDIFEMLKKLDEMYEEQERLEDVMRNLKSKYFNLLEDIKMMEASVSYKSRRRFRQWYNIS